MDDVSALVARRNLFEALLLWSDVCVIVGVFLEVFESLKELKRTPERVEFDDVLYKGSHVYGTHIPESKPIWQKRVAFLGWVLLFFGLIAELFFSEKLRVAERDLANERLSAIELRLPPK